ncbi:MAG: calcium-binding protein, partial [Solirubrobacteraceae bacterium]
MLVLRRVLPSMLVAGLVAVACSSALGASAGSDLTTFSYRASTGETNSVVLTWEGPTVSVRDLGARLIMGCVPEAPNQVRCPTPSGDPPAPLGGCGVCSALISTGDGDDSAEVVKAPAWGLTVQLDGGTGDDTLASDAGTGKVQGGPGNDTLTGRRLDGGTGDDTVQGTDGDDEELVGGPGADKIDGNGGVDTASYPDRSGPIRVTLDGVANDGATGEGDDVRTENVHGGSGDDVLIGDDGPNELGNSIGGNDQLAGGGGPDRLIGGPGRDILAGGPGDDTLLSFSNARGIVDDAFCGAGEDDVQVSRHDRVALDCEHVYYGGTPVPRLAVNGSYARRARNGVLRLRITARPEESNAARAPATPAKGPPITGSATLRAVGSLPRGILARARLRSFSAPETTRLDMRLTTRARAQIKR